MQHETDINNTNIDLEPGWYWVVDNKPQNGCYIAQLCKGNPNYWRVSGMVIDIRGLTVISEIIKEPKFNMQNIYPGGYYWVIDNYNNKNKFIAKLIYVHINNKIIPKWNIFGITDDIPFENYKIIG